MRELCINESMHIFASRYESTFLCNHITDTTNTMYKTDSNDHKHTTNTNTIDTIDSMCCVVAVTCDRLT